MGCDRQTSFIVGGTSHIAKQLHIVREPQQRVSALNLLAGLDQRRIEELLEDHKHGGDGLQGLGRCEVVQDPAGGLEKHAQRCNEVNMMIGYQYIYIYPEWGQSGVMARVNVSVGEEAWIK